MVPSPLSISTDLQDIAAAVEAAKEARAGFLTRYQNTRARYLGRFGDAEDAGNESFSDDPDSKQPRPINLTQRVYDMYVPLLCPENVGPSCTARLMELDGAASMRKLRVGRTLKQNNFAKIDKDVGGAAFLSGEAYFNVEPCEWPHYLTSSSEMVDDGQVSVEFIDPSRVLYDPLATSWEHRQWQAVMFLVPRVSLAQIVPPEVLETLPAWKDAPSLDLEGPSKKRWEKWAQDGDLRDLVEVWVVHLFDTGTMLRGLAPGLAEMKSGQWLVEPTEYNGMEGGPLVRVDFSTLPGVATGIAPAQKMADLHRVMENIGGKMYRKTMRSKSGIVGPQDDILEDIMAADDGFTLTNEQGGIGITTVKIEGIDANDIACVQFWDAQANLVLTDMKQTGGKQGNRDMTATQSMTIQSNAMAILNAMSGQLKIARDRVFTLVGRWLDRKPPAPMEFREETPAGPMTMTLDADTIEGEEDDFTYECEAVDVSPMHPDMLAQRTLQTAMAVPGIIAAHLQISPELAAIGMQAAIETVRASRVPGLVKVYDQVNVQALKDHLMMAMQAKQLAEQAEGGPGGGGGGGPPGEEVPEDVVPDPNAQQMNPAQPAPGALPQMNPAKPAQPGRAA